jgi:Oxaloacetate decarboxylase, gamma chain
MNKIFKLLYERRLVLYGLENISANNGWAMAVTGALIVFSGLVVLSLAISQIHKVLLLWEKKAADPQPAETSAEKALPVPDTLPVDVHETACYYSPLIEQLGQPFQLVDLYQLSREKGFPHPHLTLKQFQEVKFLIPEGDGFFSWHHQPNP